MRKNMWILGVTGLAVLVATSTASAQRGRGRGWGGSGYSINLGSGYGNYGGLYGSPYYSGYGYRPYYSGYNQPYYGYSRPMISTPYYSTPTYYSYSAPTTYYSQPLYSSNDTVVEQGTAAASTEQSNYYNPTLTTSVPNGVIMILVPADAQLWFGSTATSVMGSSRAFQLPPLESGRDYTYTIRAKWMENGRERDQTKEVTFRGGQSITVDMRTAPMTTGTVTAPIPPQPSR